MLTRSDETAPEVAMCTVASAMHHGVNQHVRQGIMASCTVVVAYRPPLHVPSETILATCCRQVAPGMLAIMMPWTGGRRFKESLLDYPRVSVALSLTRDRGRGRVLVGKSGKPFIEYWPCREDRAQIVRVRWRSTYGM